MNKCPSPSGLSRNLYNAGNFKRLFPSLPPCLEETDQAQEDLLQLASTMYGYSDNHENMPAGYTYLGQFIGHDISFDPSFLSERGNPTAKKSFRTPSLDLDSVYGGGPVLMPYLYDYDEVAISSRFLLGRHSINEVTFYDLPRANNTLKTAIIPDPRNDDNIIISQLHVAFLLFHNKIATYLSKEISDWKSVFLRTQRLVQWHYQWIVLFDYLPRIVDLSEGMPSESLKTKGLSYEADTLVVKKQIEALLTGKVKRAFYIWEKAPFIPLEFSHAVFRFGHSQVLENYKFNKVRRESRRLFPSIYFKNKTPFEWMDWSLFFNDSEFVRNNKIEPKISPNLSKLPLEQIANRNLAERNLLRSLQLKLPSGQSVATKMKLPPQTIPDGYIKNFPKKFSKNTPLWYYILFEAAHLRSGERLGPVGSRLFAEVMVGLIQGDKNSFVHQSPKWAPILEGKTIDSMKKLLEYAEVFNGAMV